VLSESARESVEGRRYVVGGHLTEVAADRSEPAMIGQNLPALERKENASVQVLKGHEDRAPQAVQQTPADVFSPDPLFGKSAVIQSPTMRDDLPPWTEKFDLRKAGDQLFLRGYYPNAKGFAYFVPDKWLRKTADGSYLPYGVDESAMAKEQANTIKTNDPNFRPWGDRTSDRWEDLGIAAVFVLICVGAATVFKRRGWI